MKKHCISGTLFLFTLLFLLSGAKVLANGENEQKNTDVYISVDDCKITLNKKSFVYNGKNHKPVPTVEYKGKVLKNGTDYTVDYGTNDPEFETVENCINAGTYWVYICLNYQKQPDDYSFNEDLYSYVIKKAPNPMTIKGKTFTLKRKALKKKNKVIRKTIAVKKAKGKLSFSITKVNKNKQYFTINKKTGAITVKKRLKKGTYKVWVKVKAVNKTTANYKNTAKTTAVTIKVK